MAETAVELARRLKLSPCPFCAGPPSLIVTRCLPDGSSRPVGPSDLEGAFDADEWVECDAYVFCHECGADGPHAELELEAPGFYDLIQHQAAELWNTRDYRHLRLYEAIDRG